MYIANISIAYDEKNMLKEIMMSETELNNIKREGLKKKLIYIKSNLINPNNNV